jgi:hypothetical protein
MTPHPGTNLKTAKALDLAQYQSPKLCTVAVGPVTKMTINVVGGLPPRQEALTEPALAPRAIDAV